MGNNVSPAEVLMVEDSEADVDIVRFILKKHKLHINLKVVDNGTEALDYLYRRNGYERAAPPDLVLLDINLPGLSGIDVLKEIKNSPQTKMVPVVMLTSSKHEDDIIETYSNYANCYIHKPVDLEGFQRIVYQLDQFWLSLVVLPPRP